MKGGAEGDRGAGGVLAGNVGGALWMLAAVGVFTLMQLFIKDLTHQMPLSVLVCLRMAFGVLALAPLAARRGLDGMRTRHPWLQFWRGTFGVTSMFCFAFALSRLLFADAIALTFSTPLWSMVLSIVLLGERPGPRRWCAAGVGFLGVMLIVRPQAVPDPAMLVALLGAALGAGVVIVLRRLAPLESGFTITFYSHLVGALLALPSAVLFWEAPSLRQIAVLAVIGALSTLGQYLFARALAVGEVTVVAPMEFARLPVAAVLGFVIFAELSDRQALLGMALIMASCVYIVRREAMLRRRARARAARAP
ncbi:MAG: DMT family transporter [Proteobacteria bacterium]|nr:DMT family transporter [Pseudomonadota bacterium]